MSGPGFPRPLIFESIRLSAVGFTARRSPPPESFQASVASSPASPEEFQFMDVEDEFPAAVPPSRVKPLAWDGASGVGRAGDHVVLHPRPNRTASQR